jgi:hypothetical protein
MFGREHHDIILYVMSIVSMSIALGSAFLDQTHLSHCEIKTSPIHPKFAVYDRSRAWGNYDSEVEAFVHTITWQRAWRRYTR